MLQGISKSVGVPFEAIVFDNREKKWGICKVYNYCARQAVYPYLCFVHEDIFLPTPDWGKSIINFIEHTPDCGVVGFAGSAVAGKNFWMWGSHGSGRFRYYQAQFSTTRSLHDVTDSTLYYNNPHDECFFRVITLDGFFYSLHGAFGKKRPLTTKLFRAFIFTMRILPLQWLKRK